MSGIPFQFAVTMMPTGSAAQWRDQVRWAEDSGFDMLWCPEGSGEGTPLLALAAAAEATSRIRLAPYVLATPLHLPAVTAWEAARLARLSEGRFILGLGTGRPQTLAGLGDLGIPELTPRARLDRLEETIVRCRAACGNDMPPVLIAASGPRARALAARAADLVTVALPPLASRTEVTAFAREFDGAPGGQGHGVRVATTLFSVGGEFPPWARQFVGADLAALTAADSLAILPGDVPAMVEELQRRREESHVSVYGVNAAVARPLLPVIERLAGT